MKNIILNRIDDELCIELACICNHSKTFTQKTNFLFSKPFLLFKKKKSLRDYKITI